jgi:hypothetical protein
MSVNNSTTISASIQGSGVDLVCNVALRATNSEQFKPTGNTAQFQRRVPGGSWVYIGSPFSINPSSAGSEKFFIEHTLEYRDTAVTNQNTYEYKLEMRVETEAIIIQ